MAGVSTRRLRGRLACQDGFSLSEVMVASGILATGLVTVAQLFAVSTDANRVARRTSTATILAEQKIEQLRALTWGFDPLGLPTSDFSTSVAVSPPQATGGTGLSASPPDTLTTSTTGFADYLDAYGNWIGTGAVTPSGTVFVRRWSIEPLPTNPNNTLIFQVMVTRIGQPTAAGPAVRLPDIVRMVSVKTRKAT
ncbi:MAG: hypothetical protein AB1806_19125 [Acidobacteriota bacterium]